MNSILISFFNSSNIGDLLISNSLKDSIERYSDVSCLDYLGNEVLNKMIIENTISQDSKKKKLKEKIKTINGMLHLNQIVMRMKKNMDLFSFPDFENKLNKTDALIIGGGNMVFDLSSDTLSAKRFDYYVTKAKEKGVPVFAISLGIGPFHNKYQQKYAVDALSKCDYITFRDNRSLSLFKEFNQSHKNVNVVPDPVFFMENKGTKIKTDKIGLNIINPELFGAQLNKNTIKNSYVSLINKLKEHFDGEIIIYNTEAKDYNYCKEVFDELEDKNNISLFKVNSLDDLYEVYNRSSIIIGTRMHSMITAFSQEIPIVGISWQQKVDAMFELLDDSKSVFEINNLTEEIDNIINQVSLKLEMYKNKEVTYHSDTMDKLKEMDLVNQRYLGEIFK